MHLFRTLPVGRRRAVAAAAVALTLAGLAQSAAGAEKLVVGALRFTSHSAGFIAYEKGYFKAEGLDVQFKFFQAAQPIAVAVASGDADFGIAGGRDIGFIYAHGKVLRKVESEVLVDELFNEIDAWIAAGMERPERRKHGKPAALAMAEASAIPLE